jgi:argininosuccinate lyase
MGVMTLLKGLPTSYNRDLQEDKPFVFDTVDTLELVLPAIAGAMETADFRPERIRDRMDSQLLATDLADHLVRLGVPFREGHEVVGGLVRRAEREGVELIDLPDEAFAEAHPALEGGVAGVFDWEASVEARDQPGGTSRRRVVEQLEELEELLGSGTG